MQTLSRFRPLLGSSLSVLVCWSCWTALPISMKWAQDSSAGVLYAADKDQELGVKPRSRRPFRQDERQQLSRALSASFEASFVGGLLKDPLAEWIPDTFVLNVDQVIPLTHDRYAHFLQDPTIERMRVFSRRWRTVLAEAEKRYGVDKEVITAILMIETRLGNYVGKFPVLSVYASLWLESLKVLQSKEKLSALPERLQRRAKRKNTWALKELTALLELHQRGVVNALKLKGSFSGAFGMAQFLPTSYQKWAKPYSGRGAADLFWEADAITSVGNYLSAHGYVSKSAEKTVHTPEKRLEKQRSAVFAYNRSNVYVDIVLEMAEKLASP